MRITLANVSIGLLFLMLQSCFNKTANVEQLVRDFIKTQEERVRPYQTRINELYWQVANEVSNDSVMTYYSHLLIQQNVHLELQSGLNPIFNDYSDYQFIQKVRESGEVSDELLQRQLEILWQLYQGNRYGHDDLEKQRADLINCWTKINCIKEPGWRHNDSLFLVYQQGIKELRARLGRLAQSANRFAMAIGKDNYWTFLLSESDVNEVYMDSLVKAIEKVTRYDFIKLKSQVDRILCDSLNLSEDQLVLQYYNLMLQQCQRPQNWNNSRSKERLISDCVGLFASYGLGKGNYIQSADVRNEFNASRWRSMILNCDSYYDVRFCSSLPFNDVGMVSFVEEVGGLSVYSQINKDVPYFLRQPDKVVEMGMRTLCGNLPFVSSQVRKCLDLNKPSYFVDFAVDNPWFLFRLRYLLVISSMEREIFQNPEQDLTQLYWKFVKQYLFIDIPNSMRHAEWINDYSLILLDGAAQYELLGCVWAGHIFHKIMDCDVASQNLIKKVLATGNTYPWCWQIERLTGQSVNPAFLRCLYLEEG